MKSNIFTLSILPKQFSCGITDSSQRMPDDSTFSAKINSILIAHRLIREKFSFEIVIFNRLVDFVKDFQKVYVYIRMIYKKYTLHNVYIKSHF